MKIDKKVISILLLLLDYILSNMARENYELIKSKALYNMLQFEQLKFKTENEMKSALGAILNVNIPNLTKVKIIKEEYDEDSLLDDPFPYKFDTRIQWPDCIDKIQNQYECGSSYAFASTSVLHNRICILSKGKIKKLFSQQGKIFLLK